MALNLTTLLPAKINTSEIATKYDVSSSITAYNPANYINANTTTIDGGKITTGSITAGQIAANTITTSNLSTNIGLVNGYVYSSNFNGNVSGNIGIPTAGFRLSSNAAGTEADPTIYGAYIKGGTVKGAIIDGATLIGEVLNITNLKVANSSYPLNTTNFVVYAQASHVSTGVGDYGGYSTFYSSSYDSGFLSNRIISSSQLRIIRIITIGSPSGLMQRRIDNGAWITIASAGAIGNIYDTSAFASLVEYRAYSENDSYANQVEVSYSIEAFNIN